MNEKKVEDKIFEALFRQAIIDDFNEEIDSIPTNKKLSKIYSFSEEFEIRMRKLIKKDQRKDFSNTIIFYGRKIALILIVVSGLLFSTLLFNTEVRATVGKVIVEWYEKFTSFTFRDDQVINDKKVWTLNYLPEGYDAGNYEQLGNITIVEFINNQGDKIRFSYRPENSITNISVDNENHEIEDCTILNKEAFCITATDDKFDNGVIWNIEGYTFDLWGKIPFDELKKMAKSILEK